MKNVKKVKPVIPPYPFDAYAKIISPLPPEDGGGFMVSFADLPGCISDGETEAEALENSKDAFMTWVAARTDMGKTIPEPSARPSDFVATDASGRLLARLPKYLHTRLTLRAQREGVSVNSLVLAFIAAGLGQS